jgi:uncharacterized tellurite resistance protein B-like protein
MFDYLKKILIAEKDEQVQQPGISKQKQIPLKKLEVASAALFIEIARADGDFSDDERKRIIDLMKNEFDLDDECVNELLELSEKKVQQSVSVYEFTSIINEGFSQQEKLELLKNLWRVIYVDGKLDSHEDQLIKIIGTTMNIEHKDIIGAKLLVKDELGK